MLFSDVIFVFTHKCLLESPCYQHNVVVSKSDGILNVFLCVEAYVFIRITSLSTQCDGKRIGLFFECLWMYLHVNVY